MAPRTRYAPHHDLNLAYQVSGEGPPDIVIVPSFVSNVELHWGHPASSAWLARLSSFARLVVFDKAGTGLSDPVAGPPTLEERAAEVESVMDAVGCERAVLFGLSEGGPASILFTATRPERVQALVLFGTYPRGSGMLRADGPGEELGELPEPYRPTPAQLARVAEFERLVRERWGEGEALALLVPNQGGPQQLGLIERLCASPGMARATLESGRMLDVSDVLPTIAAPTLVVHADEDLVPVQMGRYIADHIPGAQMLEVHGRDHAPWLSDPDLVADRIEQFLTGARHAREPERVLATVLFTDIVGSTERAAQLGDARWRAVIERHGELTRRELARFAGREVKSLGDGFLATFEGPARAIRCADAIAAAVRELDIEIRSGIHTGECESIGDDVGGLAVHIAARVCGLAGPGEILVSRTVRDLVVGSGIAFEDRGVQTLKGVPGEWTVLAVARDGERADAPEVALTRMPTPGPRDTLRARDRMAAAMARRAPSVLRMAHRLDRRGRRAA
jgi:class 3 adenylate cyclase